MIEKDKVKRLRLDELDNAILNVIPKDKAMTASEIYIDLAQDVDTYYPFPAVSTVATRLRRMTGWNRYIYDDRATPLERVVLNHKVYYMHRNEED